MQSLFHHIAPLRIAKIAFGGFVAIAIANFLGLSYSTSAGVIAILSLQNTRRETLTVVIRRIIAFFIALGLAFLCFTIVGYHLAAIGLFLLLFAFICQIFSLQDALVMNTVLIFHFFAEQSMQPVWIRNELLLLLVGAIVGVTMNLYMPGTAATIRKNQAELETAIRGILHRMANQLLIPDKQSYSDHCFAPLNTQLTQMEQQAFENQNNTLLTDSRYFIRYVSMRQAQQEVLRRLYDNIHRLNQVPQQAHAIAAFIQDISASFHEYNNATALLQQWEQLMTQMKQQPLPQSRAEFENRALLYRILYDLQEFLQIKQRFSQSLTAEERSRFWNE